MTDIPPPQTPAGWYLDGVPGQQRWWDGTMWTEITRPSEAAEIGGTAGVDGTAAGGSAPARVRGITGYAEIEATELVYRARATGPALQRIPLRSIEELLRSASGNTFDVRLRGSRRRKRPSLFSETSLQCGSRTSRAEWDAFLRRLELAIAAAAGR